MEVQLHTEISVVGIDEKINKAHSYVLLCKNWVEVGVFVVFFLPSGRRSSEV